MLAVVAVLCAGAFFAGVGVGRGHERSATSGATHRDFMFEVIGLKTPNQGGQTLNLFIHYRYNDGIATANIPNYVAVRRGVVTYLATTDLSKSPYWETLNNQICAQIKNGYPIAAVSCEMQVVGSDTPGHSEPGYHASIETIGDIEALSIPGPPAQPPTHP